MKRYVIDSWAIAQRYEGITVVENSTLKKMPIRTRRGHVILLEKDQIFYIEADGDDSLVRTARRKLYRHTGRLEEVESLLPSLPFFRIHRSYIVNLDRVYELRSRGPADHELKLDPPVNKVLPISRRRYGELKEILGI